MSNEMAKRARDRREVIPVITVFTFVPFVSHKNTTIRDPRTEFLVRVALTRQSPDGTYLMYFPFGLWTEASLKRRYHKKF